MKEGVGFLVARWLDSGERQLRSMPLDRTVLYKGKLQCVQKLPREMSMYRRHAMSKVNYVKSRMFAAILLFTQSNV